MQHVLILKQLRKFSNYQLIEKHCNSRILNVYVLFCSYREDDFTLWNMLKVIYYNVTSKLRAHGVVFASVFYCLEPPQDRRTIQNACENVTVRT